MISYYPGDLPPITGNPDDIFLCDPIKEAASEYLQSEAKRRKEISLRKNGRNLVGLCLMMTTIPLN